MFQLVAYLSLGPVALGNIVFVLATGGNADYRNFSTVSALASVILM